METVSEKGLNFLAPVQLLNNSKFEVSKPILRHDVDFSLFGLNEIAQIDASLGHQSIFLFRPDSPNYNLLGDDALAMINLIYAFGHEIGLHIDGRSRWANEESLGLIKSAFKVPFRFISWHRPTESDLGKELLRSDLINLYSRTLFTKSRYLSDSAGEWSEDKLQKLQTFIADGDYFQLLLHSEWWIHPVNQNPAASFSYSLEKQFQIQIDVVETEVRTFKSLGIRNLFGS